MQLTALTWSEAQATECDECRSGFDVAAMRRAHARLGTCGWQLTQAGQTTSIYVGLVPGLRPQLRIVAWHGLQRDRALLQPVLQAAPPWGCVEARGTHGQSTCTAVSVTSLHRWGFLPLSPAPDAWWRADVGPMAKVKSWWRDQRRQWRLPQTTLSDPVTSRRREG